MKQRHLSERDREIKANLRALIKESKIPLKRVRALDLRAVADAFPELVDGGLGEDKQESSAVYHWPATSQRELIGIVICDSILKKTSLRPLSVYVQQNAERPLSGSRALFERLTHSNYWEFTAFLRMDERTRKYTAIEFGLSACYLWPKQKSQFVYVAKSEALLRQCPTKGCIGVVGSFIVRAPADANAYVEHGQAFYLTNDLALVERGGWKSKRFGLNERQFVILYELTYTTRGCYTGVIAVERTHDDVAVRNIQCAGDSVNGTRAFRGDFFLVEPTESNSRGGFYCEELDVVLQTEGSIRELLCASAHSLLGQLP